MPDTPELLFCVGFSGAPGDSSAVAELSAALDAPFCAHTDVDAARSDYVFYFEEDAARQAFMPRLSDTLRAWDMLGIPLSPPRPFEMRREDWTEVWKRFFKVQRVSPRLVVKASWLSHDAKPGEVVVEIDPGMSFGTGAHETTQFCLAEIERMAATPGLAFLDAGCGSGILAIAAALLGYGRVDAFDVDQEAVASTIENARRNGLDPGRIGVCQKDIRSFAAASAGAAYDVVAANLISECLAAHAGALAGLLAPGGALLAAGILDRDFPSVSDAFAAAGLRLLRSACEKEWRGGVFIRG